MYVYMNNKHTYLHDINIRINLSVLPLQVVISARSVAAQQHHRMRSRNRLTRLSCPLTSNIGGTWFVGYR